MARQMLCIVDSIVFVLNWSHLSHFQIVTITVRFNLYIVVPNKVTGTTQVTQFYYLTKDKFIHLSSITYGPSYSLQSLCAYVCVKEEAGASCSVKSTSLLYTVTSSRLNAPLPEQQGCESVYALPSRWDTKILIQKHKDKCCKNMSNI